jgi:hypothetical protein
MQEVAAPFPRGELQLETHSSGEGVVGVDIPTRENTSFAQAYCNGVGVGRGSCLTTSR